MRAQLFLLGLVLLLLLPVAGAAQTTSDAIPEAYSREEWLASYRHFGIAASASFPYTRFGDRYDTGFGLHALADFPLVTLINIAGDVGWTRFASDGEGDFLDVFNAIVEGRFVFAFFFVGGGTGYLSGVDDFGWVPSLGLRFDRAELAVRWVAAGPDAWTTLRAGFYF
jgi:hypothetical protein